MSQDATGEELGLDRQEELCRELVARRGWTVDDANVYRETISATKSKARAQYRALLRRIQSGEIDTAVCVDQDRLLRQPIELERLIELADTLGLWIVTVSGDMDLTTEDGQFKARIEAAVARKEVTRKGERQRRAEMQAVDRGMPPRRRAFGYKRLGLEADPVEAPAVADAYAMLLAGSSLASIARMLNDRGLTTSLGRPWEPTAVRTVLMNARNAAIRTYYGEESGPGTWPAIVDRDTYDMAVALLRDPARQTSGGTTARKHLGAGLYRCGVCAEQGIDSDVMTAYRGRAAGSGRIYRCRKAKHLTRLADPIDAWVTAVIEARLARPDLADLLTGENPELGSLQAEADALRAKVRRIEADYGDGEISARQMREQVERQAAELRRIDRRIAELTRTSRLAAVVADEDPVAAFRALDTPARQGIVDALATVTLLPGRPGRRDFDPATVAITPKVP